MELRRIVISKEIIIQKLSSNKNITKEISKNDKMDCPTNDGNTFTEKLLQNAKIHQKKICIKKKSRF